MLGVLGAGVIGAATLSPLIEAWLGDGYGEAALLGAVLVLAGAAGLATGTGVAYLRAVGRPGLEARMGPLIVGVNLLLTIPLAFTAGALGVVPAPSAPTSPAARGSLAASAGTSPPPRWPARPRRSRSR